jgi:hypothetical protein
VNIVIVWYNLDGFSWNWVKLSTVVSEALMHQIHI